MAASDHAVLYVICCPTGPFFRSVRMLSLKAVGEHVRSWPGGTGGYKLSLNYAPTFLPQREANKEGYDQVLWLLDDNITEAGAMNFFAVLKRDDGGESALGYIFLYLRLGADLDVVTPPTDGTILPGVTRDSCIALVKAHGADMALPGLQPSVKLHLHERAITLTELTTCADEGRLLEVFTVGTAVVVASVGRIGCEGKKEITLPQHDGMFGPVARALYDKITAIQEGRDRYQDWSVVCE